MTFSLIYNQMKYFRSQNIIWKDYLKWGNNGWFYKVVRFDSLFVSDLVQRIYKVQLHTKNTKS